MRQLLHCYLHVCTNCCKLLLSQYVDECHSEGVDDVVILISDGC